jgi:hypothetical protein
MNYEHDDDSAIQQDHTIFSMMETNKRHQPTTYVPESMSETNIELQQPSPLAKKAKMMANNFRGHFENRPILKAVEYILPLRNVMRMEKKRKKSCDQ